MKSYLIRFIVTAAFAYASSFGLAMVSSVPISMFIKHNLSVDTTSTLVSTLPIANIIGIIAMLFVLLLFAVLFLIKGTHENMKSYWRK